MLHTAASLACLERQVQNVRLGFHAILDLGLKRNREAEVAQECFSHPLQSSNIALFEKHLRQWDLSTSLPWNIYFEAVCFLKLDAVDF